MAQTMFPLNHPLARSLWSRRLDYEALHACKASMFISKDTDSLCQEKDETTKDAGSKITFGLRNQLQGSGKKGNDTLKGSEEALVYRYDSLVIEQLRHAVAAKGSVDQQRVPYSNRDECNSGLRDWWSDRLDTGLINQISGNTNAETSFGDIYTGMNPVTAPTKQVYANSKTAESGGGTPLASGDKFTLDLITKARVIATTGRFPIRPLLINGMPRFVLFLHPYQVLSLKTNTNTAQWLDIQKAAMQGGLITKNPIFTGALGEYDGVLLHEDWRVPWGTNAQNEHYGSALGVSNVCRAPLCGAQSAMIAYGRENGSKNRFKWVEELTDYENELGVAAGMIFGIKKTRYKNTDDSDPRDFGVVTISSYEAAPA